jgi:uncharacterized short protein YbdD (DUF466 family)
MRTASALVSDVRSFAERAMAVVRTIVGIPNYERYVQHLSEHHPETEPVSPEAFLQKCWEDKYSRPGHRCC